MADDEKDLVARGPTTGTPQASRTASEDAGTPSDWWNSKPETAREALARWDAGDTVWTVEMGGLGPGYEQVIHIAAFEFVRVLLTREPIAWPSVDVEGEAAAKVEWRAFTDAVEAEVQPRIRGLGMSGAQFGAAQNLAYRTVRLGWKTALDELPADRLIQVSRTWPRLDEPPSAAAVREDQDPPIVPLRENTS